METANTSLLGTLSAKIATLQPIELRLRRALQSDLLYAACRSTRDGPSRSV